MGFSSTEAVGVLMSVEDDTITIVDRRGNQRAIRLADVEAAKVFPA